MLLQSCFFLHPAIFEGAAGKTSQEAEVKSSIYGCHAEQGRDEELDVDFFYSDKVKSLNQDEIRSYRF